LVLLSHHHHRYRHHNEICIPSPPQVILKTQAQVILVRL
jgi:hypothetical protein